MIFISFYEISTAQLVRKNDNSIEVREFLLKELSSERYKELLYKLAERLRQETTFKVIITEKLNKTKNGKTKLIITEQ